MVSKKWRISAKSGDLGDAIEIEQTVTPSVPVTVRQAMLLQIEKSTTVPVAQPDGARANAGGVSVDWKASLGDAALTEVRKWMRAYPFICLEQKTSKLAALGDRDGWDALMRELPKYLDGNGLARYFPTTQLPGSEILTAYVLDTAAALKWPIPNAEKTRMVNALRAQLAGRAQALDWAPQDVSVARALALQATVIEQEPARALERIVTPQDMAALPTTALVDWIRYLLASPKDATRGDALKEAAATLRSRYDVQGTRLNWRNEARENWWWFMWNGNVAAAQINLQTVKWEAADFAAAGDDKLPTGKPAEEWKYGDIDAGFKDAKLVIDESFVAGGYPHHSMETRSTFAYWEGGKCYLHGSNQSHTAAVPNIARFIGIPPEDLVFIAEYCGGGFGSKIFIYAEETVCVWAAKKVGRPVKWTAERSEALHAAPWEEWVEIPLKRGGFKVFKHHRDIQDAVIPATLDVVFWDAFGPKKQEGVWGVGLFDPIFQALVAGGIFVTYSAAGDVKRALQSVGFGVKKLDGPPYKRHMLRAQKV